MLKKKYPMSISSPASSIHQTYILLKLMLQLRMWLRISEFTLNEKKKSTAELRGEQSEERPTEMLGHVEHRDELTGSSAVR